MGHTTLYYECNLQNPADFRFSVFCFYLHLNTDAIEKTWFLLQIVLGSKQF
jgi:hypothetical protein